MTVLRAAKSGIRRERTAAYTAASGTLGRRQSLTRRRRQEVVPRNHRQLTGIPRVSTVTAPARAFTGGHEQPKRYPPTPTQQITQFSELVAAGVADPNAQDDRLARVGECNCLGDLWQRRRVDNDDVALLR